MVRASIISHPSEWATSGFNEIQEPPERYTLIDRKGLRQLCGIPSDDQLIIAHGQWVKEALEGNESSQRD